MSELEVSEDDCDLPSPQLLQDTLKRIIRRVTDQVAAELVAEREQTPNSRRPHCTSDPSPNLRPST